MEPTPSRKTDTDAVGPWPDRLKNQVGGAWFLPLDQLMQLEGPGADISRELQKHSLLADGSNADLAARTLVFDIPLESTYAALDVRPDEVSVRCADEQLDWEEGRPVAFQDYLDTVLASWASLGRFAAYRRGHPSSADPDREQSPEAWLRARFADRN